MSRLQLADALTKWLGCLPGSVTIASDSFTDWELLLDALGEARPANLKCFYDLRGLKDSASFYHASVRYHELNGPWHHALHDAVAHRCGWIACFGPYSPSY